MKEDVKIIIEHNERNNNKEIADDIKQVLNKEKEKGILDFEVRTRRKCDYCNKTLTDKDKFTTIKNGDKILDKCEDCE